MLRKRPSWQRASYRIHFARGRQNGLTICFLRTVLLFFVFAMFMSIFINYYSFTGLRNTYIVLLAQQLPGIKGTLTDDAMGKGKEGSFSLTQAYTAIVANELSGFRAAEIFRSRETPAELPVDINKEEKPSAEHLLAVSHEADEGLSAAGVGPPVPTFLTVRGTLFAAGRFPPVETAPQVLIYHTHTTESFLPVSGKAFSSDPRQSVVFLGEYLAEILESQYGIPVLHHRQVFDLPRSAAYAQALPAITAILEKNPQINVVVDLHRDGISREVTTFMREGKSTARILFVVGTRHESWNSNLRFALFLQNVLDENYPGLCRGTRRQSFTYNQHVHPRSVLVEIGGHENNRDEVMQAVPYLAEALARAFP